MTSEPMVPDLREMLEDRAAVVRDPNVGFQALSARVAHTPQRHHRWLPVPPPSWPTQGAPSVFSATRIVAAVTTLALISSGILVGRQLLPEPVEPLPAITAATPTAAMTEEPEPALLTETSAEATFVSTGRLHTFEPGEAPTNLDVAADGSSLYGDIDAGATYRISSDGYRHVLGQAGHSYTRDVGTGNLNPTNPQGRVSQSPTLQAPHSVARAGDTVLIQDAAGTVWARADNYESAPLWARLRIEPSSLPLEIVSSDRLHYDIYALDETSGDVVRFGQDGKGRREQEPVVVTDRKRRPTAVAMHADGLVYVLTDAGVERHRNGKRTPGWKLADPPGDPPDYRYMEGTRRNGKGELWLFDAAADRLVVFDKASGDYLGSWAPPSGEVDFGELQGFVLESDGSGHVEAVRWFTPEAIMRSALTDPSIVVEARRGSFTHDGVLTPSTRDPGERASSFVDGPIGLEADVIRLSVGNRSVDARGVVHVDGIPSRYRGDALELTWFEDGAEQRLYLEMEQDDTHWWVEDIRALDGERYGKWLEFEDLESLTRTPLGEALEGDLRIPNTKAARKKYVDRAVLEIDGMRLTAPTPADRAAPLQDCTAPDAQIQVSTGPDGRLWVRGDDRATWRRIAKMTPREAEQELQAMGLCYRFSYSWWTPPYSDDRLNDLVRKHGVDMRCSAPDAGEIEWIQSRPDVDWSKDIVIVGVQLRAVREGPAPPPYGTDCEPLVPS